MNDNNKLPTINDVAHLSGVSKRTVSRVLNNSSKVNETTRARVQAVIEQLNFAPNRQARGLAARRSYLLGLIYDVPTLFINDIQKGMLNVCEGSGYEVVVHACHIESDNLVDDVTRFVNRANLDGVLVLPPVSDIDILAEKLEEMDCRFVRFSSKLGNKPWKQVVTDYLPAIMDMTGHLVGLGHRDFGFISGPPSHVSSQKRQEVFIQALASHGLNLSRSMMAEGAFTYDSGVRAAKKLLSLKHRPTAIFAANDEMAFGVMNVADEMGIKVPDDLSVVGFDGTPFSTFVIPSLSTIIRQTDEMAHLGTKKLLALINEGPDAARSFETMVSPRFLPRESTGPAPTD
ncbi:MAG: LacI family DNA-binding transcriptional regulator [Xanthomonadales bacterium]|jgi:LacI family transcriptional regulator|nr:LacI family DNA-binding transcriptional regulator [Xanthomonadales bacterium]